MKTKIINVLMVLCLISFTACSQNKPTKEVEVQTNAKQIKTEPHTYGGWYCPDNLNGFPPVDIQNWKNVPVVNGRMATKEETQNGTSLIFVDTKKYPNAKVLDIKLPKLANYYNEITRRNDLIIVIQAIHINNDSIVGFRYLNGGNGSARLNEIEFLSDNEIKNIPNSKFVTYSININSSQDNIWKVLTKKEYTAELQPIFDKNNLLNKDWREVSNVNFHYNNDKILTSQFARKLFGNFYIQNDYKNALYNEKFLLLENLVSKNTELKIVCGPFEDDYENQKNILIEWASKVKELSKL
ncbi:hypothetical protein [uncultured Lutibacter sp.]|uniref:hypothetical protein n=1 Tax=uncultured Lutibacter sp. TaxID=437739 RepID=UPI002633DFD0|nr:hypothetical protein [uncultured Lutibacter sp.]